LAERAQAFADWPQGVQTTPEAAEPAAELAEMMGVNGGLVQAAANAHEDMCLLVRSPEEAVYRLVGAAVAWPSDWYPEQKIGLPLRALHAPIAGYEEQLASGVDHFMEKLAAGPVFGRCNWFIAPTGEKRWLNTGDAKEAFAHVTPEKAGETLFVRSERQTLRRLPQTGAILFTIGIYVEPLGALSLHNIRFLAGAARSLVSGEGERRGTGAYASALIGYADAQDK
ncbi:MAG: DUF3445 domain-containing protein, partial [Pseudomonadota bacterium]|nr:DUF3445 domain-containing protein [Pseudomonadota bacterium]